MLRAGPRELSNALGQETDENELMEMGRARPLSRKDKKAQSPDRSKEKDKPATAHGTTLSPEDRQAMVLLIMLCRSRLHIMLN